MAKVYYIEVVYRNRVAGRVYPGAVLENAKVQFRFATPDEKAEDNQKDDYAIFERRAQARKGLKAMQDRNPGVPYRIREIGSTQRDCSREVKGWALVYHKITFSAFNKFEEGGECGAVADDFEKHTFDLLGQEWDDESIFKRREVARMVAKFANDMMADMPGNPSKPYRVVPVYA